MTRALLLPLAAILALATGVGLLGVATTLRSAPVAVRPTPSTPEIVATATIEVAARAATPPGEEPAATDALAAAEALIADVPVALPDGPALLRVERVSLAPGAVLPPAVAAGPTALVVETGTVRVLATNDGWAQVGPDVTWVNLGPDTTLIDAALHRGEQAVLRPGAVRTVRNAGPAPAVVLVVAIEPVGVASTSP
jgi:quercetin dioxygenase-like cupin family protein